MRSWRFTPSTSSSIASGWSPLGSKSDLMTSRCRLRISPGAAGGAASRSAVPPLVGEFLAALAQQPLQRLRGGGDARRRGVRVDVLVARHAVAERLRELGVDRHRLVRRLADVVRLRRLVEALGRLARPVRGGEIGAAVERIVRRRLEPARLGLRLHPGLRADAGGALADRRIEQVGERRVPSAANPAARALARVGLRRVLLGMLRRIARRIFWGISPSVQYGPGIAAREGRLPSLGKCRQSPANKGEEHRARSTQADAAAAVAGFSGRRRRAAARPRRASARPHGRRGRCG